jgi:hypothetical protein
MGQEDREWPRNRSPRVDLHEEPQGSHQFWKITRCWVFKLSKKIPLLIQSCLWTAPALFLHHVSREGKEGYVDDVHIIFKYNSVLKEV